MARRKKDHIAKKGLTAVDGYDALFAEVVRVIEDTRRAAARSVNAVMTATYWLVGQRIVELEQGGATRAGYGETVMERLSADLTARFGRGFSRQNLQQMRQFYLVYPPGKIRQTASGESPRTPQIRQTPSGESASELLGAAGMARSFPLPSLYLIGLTSRLTLGPLVFLEPLSSWGLSLWSSSSVLLWHGSARLTSRGTTSGEAMRNWIALAVFAAPLSGCNFSQALDKCQREGRCSAVDAGPQLLTSLNVSSFGAIADGKTDATDAFRRALEAAANASVKPVVLDLAKGTYLLACADSSNAPCLRVAGASMLRLDGHGALLNIGNPYAGGFHFEDSTGVTISNLTIDYEAPPFTQGTITAIDTRASTFDLSVDPGMPAVPDSLCSLLSTGGQDDDLGYYPNENWGILMERGGVKHAPDGWLPVPSACQPLGGRAWRFTLPPDYLAHLAVKDRYVHSFGAHWTKTALRFTSCRDPSLHRVTVHTSPEAAVVFALSVGTIHVDNLTVGRQPGSPRLLSCIDSGLVLHHNWATPIIEQSSFEGMGAAAISNYSIACRAVSAENDGGTGLRVLCNEPIRSGDSIQIVEPNAGILRGVASVSSAVPLSDDPRVIDLVLDRPIDPIYGEPQGTSGDLVFDTSAASPGTIIRGNTFGRHLGVSILNCASQSLIADNVFDDVNLAAIRLMPDFAWGVGPIPHEVIIDDNQIAGGDNGWVPQIFVRGDALSGTPRDGPADITLKNNTLRDAPGLSIDIGPASSVWIEHNHVFADIAAPRLVDGAVISIRNSSNVTVDTLNVADSRPGTLSPLVRVDASSGVTVTNVTGP